MKLAIVHSGQIKRCPHIQIFRTVLSRLNVGYDIICWDRDEKCDTEGIICNHKCPTGSSQLKKLWSYYKFTEFAIKTIRRNQYDKLIIIGSPIGICLYNFLKQNYPYKFWLDYRDLSIEQKFRRRFKKLLDISEYISISSPGYKKVLPKGYKFILSHNLDVDIVKKILSEDLKISSAKTTKRPIVVSTIGYLRDTQVNIDIIEGLKNNNKFQVRFIGDGPAGSVLRTYVENNKIKNVDFIGMYERENEHLFYETTDFVNIYMPTALRSTLMTNRIYNALLYKKPVIVAANSTQSEYVEKYNLGIAVEDCNNLAEKIEKFEAEIDEIKYIENCNILLNEFVDDYNLFEKKMIDFIQKYSRRE